MGFAVTLFVALLAVGIAATIIRGQIRRQRSARPATTRRRSAVDAGVAGDVGAGVAISSSDAAANAGPDWSGHGGESGGAGASSSWDSGESNNAVDSDGGGDSGGDSGGGGDGGGD